MSRVRSWLRWLGALLLAWGQEPEDVVVKARDALRAQQMVIRQKILVGEAVKQAFGRVGLPLAQHYPEFDLQHTGKLQEIIHHASHLLAIDNTLKTVADVERLLLDVLDIHD